jgi:hypothetical protein
LVTSQEERQVSPGHYCLMKFGKVSGSNRYIEKFKLDTHKYEEYKGVHVGKGDYTLVVDV